LVEFFIKAAQMVLSLSILVILHELGHFLPAKWFGVRVEKFYLFFDPWFSLFKFKKGDTEYGIGWLPLGGYVKLSGMIDESMDKEQMAQEPQPYEFRSKPAWQRLIVMIGGVTVNAILAIIIYAMVLFTWGETYLPASEAKYGVDVHEYFTEFGLQNGDQIVGFNGNGFPAEYTYGDIFKEMMLDETIQDINVVRNGETLNVALPADFEKQVLSRKVKGAFMERIPFVVDSITKNGTAAGTDLQKGDKLMAVNGQSAEYFLDFVRVASEHKGETVTLEVLRNGSPVSIEMPISENGKIGVGNKSPADFFNLQTHSFGFFESFPAGYNKASNTIVSYVRQFKLVFTKEGASQIGGFGTLGGLFPSTWNWQTFWSLTAFLSIVLAFMNILPIPALDGGHVLFLIYEIIAGKAPGEKFMEYAQTAGMILLLGLLLWANGNDFIRAIMD
jgi:regulator of sigma E protease